MPFSRLFRAVGGAAVVLVVLVFLAAVPQSVAASSSDRARKGVIVLVNSINLQDILAQDLPTFETLIDEGTVGLLSPRTASATATIERSYLSMGAGTRSQGNNEAALGFNRDERWQHGLAGEWYETVSGKGAEGEVVHVGVAALANLNERVNYDVFPGLLGGELKKAGLKTAVIGNADLARASEKVHHREAVLIAMDEDGTVDYGNVGPDLIVADSRAAFGIRTDYEALEREFNRVLDKANLIVIETGDTFRADAFGGSISDELRTVYREQALKRVDRFLGRIYPTLDREDTVLFIAAPSPARTDRKRDELTPLVIWGAKFKGGLGFSATTRRPGLVTNPDVAPTILDHFGIERPSGFIGRPIAVAVAAGDRMSLLERLAGRTDQNDRLQPALIVSYIVIALASFVLAAVLLVLSRRRNRLVTGFLSGLLLYVIALPLAFFVLPLILPAGSADFLYLGAPYLVALGLVLLALLFRAKPLGPVALLAAGTTLVVGVDLLTGSILNMNTVFGYSPIVAGRFYGIGNQGLGIFLAASLLAAVSILEWRRRFDHSTGIVVLVYFAVITAIVGFPRWGADVGGTIACTVAFGVTYLALAGKKITWRMAIVTAVVAVVALTAFAAVDLIGSKDQQTHLGRTIEMIQADGEGAAFQIVQRKLVTNLRILRFSSWSYFFWFIFGLILYLRYRPTGQFQKLLASHPFVSAGISGAFAGGLVGFLVNDSGIVIPALMLSYFMAAIFFVMIQGQFFEAPEGQAAAKRVAAHT